MVIPELVAHRGYRLHYPENTLIAVEAALRAGARYVEIDVQLSHDRVPMLFHDADLMRVCGTPGAVKDYTAVELQRFKTSEYQRFGYRYAKTRMATLEEFTELLTKHSTVTAFVEIKVESLTHFGVAETLDAVRASLRGVEEHAVLISYAHDVLAAARQARWPSVGAVLDRWKDRNSSALRDIAPQYIFCDVNDLPRFGRLRANNARLAVFEVDDPKVALRLARRGVDLVETFAVGELRKAFDLLYPGGVAVAV
jgi:glycerophosphoryl diester phosphodiesterase